MSTLAHEGLLGNPTLKIISAARWHVHTYLIGDGITGHPANLQTAPPVEGPAIPPLPPWHAAPPVEGPAIPPLPHWRAAVALACVPTPATAPQAPEATPPPSRAVAALAAVPKAAPKPATKPDPQADAEMAAIRSRCAALAEEAWPDYVADLRAALAALANPPLDDTAVKLCALAKAMAPTPSWMGIAPPEYRALYTVLATARDKLSQQLMLERVAEEQRQAERTARREARREARRHGRRTVHSAAEPVDEDAEPAEPPAPARDRAQELLAWLRTQREPASVSDVKRALNVSGSTAKQLLDTQRGLGTVIVTGTEPRLRYSAAEVLS